MFHGANVRKYYKKRQKSPIWRLMLNRTILTVPLILLCKPTQQIYSFQSVFGELWHYTDKRTKWYERGLMPRKEHAKSIQRV